MSHHNMLPKKTEHSTFKVLMSIFSAIFFISLILIVLTVADITQIGLFVVIIGIFLMALLANLDTQR